MNDLDYLNQISAEANSHSAKPSLLNLFGDKTKYILGALVLVLIIFVVLVVTSASSSTDKTIPTETSELGRLYNRSESLLKTVSKYNPLVSKPSIRSTGSSFSTLLTDISSTVSSYLNSEGIKPETLSATADDTKKIDELNTNLEKARLNGTEVLNRTYAREMHYQVRLLIIIEDSIINKTANSKLKAYLESSKESANLLVDAFYGFSEN